MASRRAVYVNQHEFAVSHPGDDCARVLGSEDATTCHIVVLRWVGEQWYCTKFKVNLTPYW